MNSNELNLKLTIDELNVILNAVGLRPYVEVAALIESIRRQTNEQLNPQNFTNRVIDTDKE